MGSWGKVDYSQFQQMADRLQKALDERAAEQFIYSVLNEMGNTLLRKTKRRTPVDTGRLKRDWQISRVRKKGSVYEIEVYNNTEYAPFVENGHRIVTHGKTVGYKDGVFMLRISADEVERMFPALLQKRSDELLLKIFGG